MPHQKPRTAWRPTDAFRCVHHFIGDLCVYCFHREPPATVALRRLTAAELGLPEEPARIPITRGCGCDFCRDGHPTAAAADDPIGEIAAALWHDAGDGTPAEPDHPGPFAVRCVAGHVTHPKQQHWIHDPRCYYEVYKPGRQFCFNPAVPLNGAV